MRSVRGVEAYETCPEVGHEQDVDGATQHEEMIIFQGNNPICKIHKHSLFVSSDTRTKKHTHTQTEKQNDCIAYIWTD